MKYKRVLLKLSGEALAGEDKIGINAKTVADIARQIKDATMNFWIIWECPMKNMSTRP